MIAVDDYLPTDANGNLIFDITAGDGSIWGPMMEKVWAKANGNYERIIAGDETESFDFILGAPTIEYSMSYSPINLVTPVVN